MQGTRRAASSSAILHDWSNAGGCPAPPAFTSGCDSLSREARHGPKLAMQLLYEGHTVPVLLRGHHTGTVLLTRLTQSTPYRKEPMQERRPPLAVSEPRAPLRAMRPPFATEIWAAEGATVDCRLRLRLRGSPCPLPLLFFRFLHCTALQLLHILLLVADLSCSGSISLTPTLPCSSLQVLSPVKEALTTTATPLRPDHWPDEARRKPSAVSALSFAPLLSVCPAV